MIEGQLEDYQYRIGENRNENDLLIKDADQNDLWIHIDKLPSPHCIIFNEDNKKIEKRIITQLCSKILEKTKYSGKINFIWTTIRNITRTKEPGKVIVKKIDGKIKFK